MCCWNHGEREKERANSSTQRKVRKFLSVACIYPATTASKCNLQCFEIPRTEEAIALICARAARRLDEYPPRWCSKSASHVQHRLYFSRFIFQPAELESPPSVSRVFPSRMCIRAGTRPDRMPPSIRPIHVLIARWQIEFLSRRQKYLLLSREWSSFRVKEHVRRIRIDARSTHTSVSPSFLIRGSIRRGQSPLRRKSAFHSPFLSSLVEGRSISSINVQFSSYSTLNV